ncbi:hypothetical protein QAD02_014265 [Eretmocerus hayati]|uniref:Uncharacterized protein n=1 Tax=Eretmocerus hayati TaxID=131215 RepID=A0ACC2P5T1_9HYME|nr:hypothetical protein QAD02_014265 [Eretmocerus hayati]
MAPTKKNSPSKNPVKKRAKKVMDIATKLKILDLLRDGEKISNLARRYEVNESTIPSIRDNQEAIRAASANLGVHGKFTKINRKKCVVKMENLLIVWMQDMIQKKIPLSGAAIKEQALIFFEHVKEKHFKDSVETFSASRGWFDRFRKRFSLRSISFTGAEFPALGNNNNLQPSHSQTDTEQGKHTNNNTPQVAAVKRPLETSSSSSGSVTTENTEPKVDDQLDNAKKQNAGDKKKLLDDEEFFHKPKPKKMRNSDNPGEENSDTDAETIAEAINQEQFEEFLEKYKESTSLESLLREYTRQLKAMILKIQ